MDRAAGAGRAPHGGAQQRNPPGSQQPRERPRVCADQLLGGRGLGGLGGAEDPRGLPTPQVRASDMAATLGAFSCPVTSCS